MWLKFLIGGLIIAFCVLLGYLAASKYRSRKKFFAQMLTFNERYLSELAYSRKPLKEFLAAQEFSGDFAKILGDFQERKAPEITFSYLTKEEKNDCFDYFSMLGKGDSYSQSGFFSARKEYLAEKKKATEKEAKSRGSLYLKLGLLAGLAFVILIV